ncbi:MAG: Trm112 family protein [Nocardioidaceae bacterium]
MNLDPVLLEILVCPDCKGALTVDQDHDELVCSSCGLIYPVRDDIPILLVDEARRPERASTESAPGAEPGGPTDDAG